MAGLLKPVPKAVWRRGSDRKGGGLLGSATPFGGGETSNLDHSRERDGFYISWASPYGFGSGSSIDFSIIMGLKSSSKPENNFRA